MAGKAHGNGDRRGDNTICGLGDRLRRLTAGICLITQTIFPVMAAAPTHINPAHSDTAASLILPNVKTIPYTLGALESPPTVAARFGITVDELRRLNQFRTFARGFDNVRQGDEIDVPLINSNSPEARNLKAMQMERDGKDPQMVWMKISALKALHLNFSIPGTKRRITWSSASTHFTVRMIALKPTTVSAGVISHRAGCLASICLSIMT